MSSNACNANAKSLIRTSTNLLIRDYLANGGEITVIPCGKRSK